MSKSINFSSPVDASRYIAGGDSASPGVLLKSINYDDGIYRFQVRNSDGSVNSQVNGVNVAPNVDGSPAVTEDNAATDIRTAIAATLS